MSKSAPAASSSDAAPSTPVDAAQDKAAALVEAWVQESLGNSAFSIDTAAWNHFQLAKSNLVTRVAAALKGV